MRYVEVIRIPNLRQSKKRLRQSERRRTLNRARKLTLKKIVREVRLSVDAGDKEKALSLLPQLTKAADKAAKHNTIHKNKAARIKSRWTKVVQTL